MSNLNFLLLISMMLWTSCRNNVENTPAIIHPGKVVADKYCQSCHMEVDPSILPLTIWRNDVLPMMEIKMGLNKRNVIDSTFYPSKPLLSKEEWSQINQYFLDKAPLTTPLQRVKPFYKIQNFSVIIPEIPNVTPFTTSIHIDETHELFYFGNATNNRLYSYSLSTKTSGFVQLPGTASYLIPHPSGFDVVTMGNLYPHDEKLGTLCVVNQDENDSLILESVLIKELQRPVHATVEDLNLDGNEDIVISSFGNIKGELAWYDNFRIPNSKKHVLRPLPGAVKTEIVDFNNDGYPDILALMAQGDEGFFLYTNDKKGSFEESRIISFPPTNGSTYFELIDYNKDGFMDILYANGDNGDYYPVVKDFHGIRLFLNNGKNEFSEEFFLMHHGVFKCRAADFDEDGDIDIASISYFPDYHNNSKESFVYFENTGKNSFKRHFIDEADQGKWLTMATGDIDKDGDIDIILGSALFMKVEVPQNIMKGWQTNAPPIVILENKLK